MTWQVNQLIVTEDVGRENVGHAPPPWPTLGMHVSYAPSTFVHGVPSQQQTLMRRYEQLASTPEKAVMLLTSLKVICAREGITKDADAALAELDIETRKFIIAAISSVDPFCPTYSKSHRLTW